MRARRVAAAVALALLGVGCWILPFGGRPVGPTPVRPDDASPERREQRVLKDWLECEECWEEELQAVVALGDEVIPQLVAVARGGMSAATRARLSAQLARRHEERVAYGARHPAVAPVMDRERYIAHHVGNRDHLYRVRAIRAIGHIGTDKARSALEALRRETTHPGIQAEIRRVLDAM